MMHPSCHRIGGALSAGWKKQQAGKTELRSRWHQLKGTGGGGLEFKFGLSGSPKKQATTKQSTEKLGESSLLHLDPYIKMAGKGQPAR